MSAIAVALTQAEKRLGVALPAKFKRACRTQSPWTRLGRFTLAPPANWQWLKDTDIDLEGVDVSDAIVLGEDIGGNWLVLRRSAKGLGEELYVLDHSSLELERLASSLPELLKTSPARSIDE